MVHTWARQKFRTSKSSIEMNLTCLFTGVCLKCSGLGTGFSKLLCGYKWRSWKKGEPMASQRKGEEIRGSWSWGWSQKKHRSNLPFLFPQRAVKTACLLDLLLCKTKRMRTLASDLNEIIDLMSFWSPGKDLHASTRTYLKTSPFNISIAQVVVRPSGRVC